MGKNALLTILGGIMMFAPFGFVVGPIAGIISGLALGSWGAFWAGLILGFLGACLLGAIIMGLGVLINGDSGGAGSIDNPHPHGSTEWYHHENERKKYFES